MLRADAFFSELDRYVAAHPVCRHRFLERMATERLTLAQLQSFALQHYLYSRGFACNLAAVIANTPDEDARTLLVLNMYEEIGEPARIRDRVHMLLLEADLVSGAQIASAYEYLVRERPAGDVVTVLLDRGVVSRAQVAGIVERNTLLARDLTHPALFRRFLQAIELSGTTRAAAEPLPATEQFIGAYHSVCREAHWLEALGAMGPGTECVVARLYSKILQGIVRSELVNSHDYVFWTIHVHCDDGHGRNIVDAMRPYAEEAVNQERIHRGAQRVLDARAQWLDRLYEHVFEPEASSAEQNDIQLLGLQAAKVGTVS
jgi:pyrroloquinoline quinone (PQQ) biosynthesis protein C